MTDLDRGRRTDWPGTWVADRLGVRLVDGARPVGAGLSDLVGLAVRRNPRRAHLLVSTVLGKHVPTDPRLVHGAGLLLGRLVQAVLTEDRPDGDPLHGRPAMPQAEAAPGAAEQVLPAETAGTRSETRADVADIHRAFVQALQARPGTAAVFRDTVCAGLRAARRPAQAVVVGYAETATALGHSVADALGTAPYLHSTRRRVPGVGPYGGFEEEHSHATSHLLLPVPATALEWDVPLVLVDDELSTGSTVVNTLRALHGTRARRHYVVAALVDLRSPGDRTRLEALATELGARIDVVALADGRVELPGDILRAGRDLVALMEAGAGAASGSESASGAAFAPGTAAVPARSRHDVRRVDLAWPAGLPDGGRHGFTPEHRNRLERELPRMAGTLAAALATSSGSSGPADPADPADPAEPASRSGTGRVLVLGFEELMYLPLRLAEALADLTSHEVRFSTTTRSPVLAVDVPGYAIRTRLEFPAHDGPSDGPGPRYAYNVAPGADPARGFDRIVLVVDDQADTDALGEGLLRRLTELGAAVFLVTVPAYRPPAPGRTAGTATEAEAQAEAQAGTEGETEAGTEAETGGEGEPVRTGVTSCTPSPGGLPGPLRGPAFGSYRAEDVAWLLTDLSAVRLEAPTEEREAAIQAGRAHYAESLPQEYQPSADYQRLFHEALAASADRLAHAVAAITERVLAERGPEAVLVSLARAGTPIGVLMRRWAAHAHGLDLPHYAVSIVRGRGIDAQALRYLAAHHDPARVMFVDGWTGKGAITRELTAALDAYAEPAGVRFPADLAVLADPGRCVGIFGTREDFLIPSACLNSTVSGLVSRTVLNRELIGPADFHGAKFYADLASADVSELFLDTVCERFGRVTPGEPVIDDPPDWSGWAAVERIGAAYGIGDLNLIKPGVGETTRVLLRRVPWKVLVRPGAGDDLAHIRLLAAERGVPVVEAAPEVGLDTGPYACVGLIKPGVGRSGDSGPFGGSSGSSGFGGSGRSKGRNAR